MSDIEGSGLKAQGYRRDWLRAKGLTAQGLSRDRAEVYPFGSDGVDVDFWRAACVWRGERAGGRIGGVTRLRDATQGHDAGVVVDEHLAAGESFDQAVKTDAVGPTEVQSVGRRKHWRVPREI